MSKEREGFAAAVKRGAVEVGAGTLRRECVGVMMEGFVTRARASRRWRRADEAPGD